MSAYQTYTEDELIALVRADNERAFSEVFDRYWERLLAVAMHRTGDTSDSKEIVQTVFFKLWQKRASLQLQYSLSTYLSTAVKYELLNMLAEKSRRQRLHNSPVVTTQAAHPAAELDFRELQQLVHERVKALPEKCRIIYEFSRNEGMTNRQIADALQLSEKTVENQLTIALRKLKSGIPGAAVIIFSGFWG